MKPSTFRRRWTSLRKNIASEHALAKLSKQVAYSFVDQYYQNGIYEETYIDLLCQMATFFSDPKLNNRASSALFQIIVEKLCEDFEHPPMEIYNRVLSQIVSYCRTIPVGKVLDQQLREFEIFSFEELYSRANLICTQKYTYDVSKPPERIILLSRVTIGADVAVLSVMIQRLMKIFPDAEIVLVGSQKLKSIFGGNPHIRIRELSYPRHGGLLERFSSWHDALETLSQEVRAGYEENVLLIDPDSRISQLGVLPLTRGENYLFFNSRTHVSKNGCLAKLTNCWMDSVFMISDFCYPRVWVPSHIRAQARKKIAPLREAGCQKIIAINLGVGGNPRKRLGLEFEKKLLREILKNPHTVIVLDKGFGKDELARSADLMLCIRNQGFQTVNTRFQHSDCPTISHGLMGIECTIGEIAALIVQCDEFIGYDSACQHIAAAVGTPTLTIFAGTNNMNFVRRWSPCGDTPCNIVHVDTLTNPQHLDVDEVVLQIMEKHTCLTSQSIKKTYM